MKNLLLLPLVLALALSAPAADWTTTTFAGNGQKGFSGDGGPANLAEIDNPFGLARGPDGALYFCEYGGQRIRKVNPDGTIQTVAGIGKKGYDGDGGPAELASFNLPHEIRFDRAGDFYVADMQNHAVRKVTMKTGIITTVAGTGQPGDTPDGAPVEGTPLKGPRSLDFDKEGNLWLVTREGNQVLKFDLHAGRISIVAGTGKKGFTGNGGPAREATLSGPKGIALDADGNAWLADTESHSIRVIVAKTGHIELAVGTGEKGDGPDGPASHCQLARPHGVFVDADGSIFIGDSESHRVRVLHRK